MFLTFVEWPSDVDIDDGTICMMSPVVMAMKSFDYKMPRTLVEGRVVLITSQYHDTISSNGNNYLIYEMFLTMVEWPYDIDMDDGTIHMTFSVKISMILFVY